VFGCVSWGHISDDCRNKLDAKRHSFIMMGYIEESKYCRLFDLFKQKIIIRRKIWFDEKYYGIKLLNSLFGLLQDDPFDVVSDTGSLVHFFIHSTRQSNFVPI